MENGNLENDWEELFFMDWTPASNGSEYQAWITKDHLGFIHPVMKSRRIGFTSETTTCGGCGDREGFQEKEDPFENALEILRHWLRGRGADIPINFESA